MKIPASVVEAFKRRKGPIVLTTVSADGQPNAIYATCVSQYDAERIVVADNYFDKTKRNIEAGSQGSLLFITDDDKAYQLKGVFEYYSQGPIFDDMKSWNPTKLPGHAAAVLVVKRVFSGAKIIEE